MGSLDAMRRDLLRKTSQAAQLTASDWESRLRRETPTDTGNMRQRTMVRARTTATGATILARVDTPYAHIVAGGQRPHLITEAKPGKFLHNVRTGFEAVSPVNHPGAMARTWWADALRDAPDLLARNWNGLR
jgi:hypothetical protein